MSELSVVLKKIKPSKIMAAGVLLIFSLAVTPSSHGGTEKFEIKLVEYNKEIMKFSITNISRVRLNINAASLRQGRSMFLATSPLGEVVYNRHPRKIFSTGIGYRSFEPGESVDFYLSRSGIEFQLNRCVNLFWMFYLINSNNFKLYRVGGASAVDCQPAKENIIKSSESSLDFDY